MTAAARLVVLGAGRPHRGTVPSALRRDRGGVPVLEWVMDAFAVEPSETVFVGGYGIEAVRESYPALPIVVLAEWEDTGSAESLLSVDEALVTWRDADGAAVDVVYSDVLLRRELVVALRAAQGDADVVVAWDSRWRERFPGRSEEDLTQQEKVVVEDGRPVRFGSDVAVARAHGEFVGAVRFGPRALAALAGLREDPQRGVMRNDKLSDVVQWLADGGSRVVGVDVAGDWAEVDAPADIARFVLGTKADTLARLQRTITSGRIADQVTFTVTEWEADAAEVVDRIEGAFSGRPLIVRSSTTHEDSFAASNAGGFTSVLDVRGASALVDAVGRVIASYRAFGPHQGQQQVLVQPMIEEVVLSGVVLTRTLDHGAPWRTVEYSVGADTEAVTSGAGSTFGQLRTVVASRDADGAEAMRSHGSIAAVVPAQERRDLARVFEVVEEVERLLAYDALDVEFAVDRAGDVHVLQVRPLVAAPAALVSDAAFVAASDDAQRVWKHVASAPEQVPCDPTMPPRPLYGVMPDWNPAEIIGTAPGRLAVDLYRRLVTDEVWATQRAEFGYRDVRPLPLLRLFAGRPYVDVRASFASFLPADIDDAVAGRLLAASLERLAADPSSHDKVEFNIVPTAVDPDWGRWEQRLAAEGFTQGECASLRASLTRITSDAFGRVEADLAAVGRLQEQCAAMATDTADPLRRAASLLNVTARFGTLPFAHLARSAFVAVSLLRGAESQGIISSEAVAGFLGGLHTAGHGLTVDARAVAHGTETWESFVQRWGHLRPGTYEVTSSRYDADPERFLRPLVMTAKSDAAGIAVPDNGAADTAGGSQWEVERGAFFASLDRIGLPSDPDVVERFLRTAIEGREWSKLAFTRPLSDALEDLVLAWEERGVAREDLSEVPLDLLLPDEGVPRDAGRVIDAAERGRDSRRVTSAIPFSPLLCAQGDLDVFVLTAGTPNFVGLRATLAPVVELVEGMDGSPDVAGRIVLIPRADPGFDWLFGHGIAGLVTLYGGANSHMAIRAAEFGLPAAIGVGPLRYGQLRGAAELELDPVGRTLRVLR